MSTPALVVCKYTLWYWLCLLTGEVLPFQCKSWHCPEHRQALAWSWACRIAAEGPERMVTLTSIPKDRHQASLAFQHVVRDIRRRGLAFEYCRFFEVGAQTGMYHYHLGQKGDYVPQAMLSNVARANGLGQVVDIRKCFGAGPGWYMSKYISKGLDTIPAGWRKVAASRHFFARVERPEPVPTAWVLMKGKDKG